VNYVRKEPVFDVADVAASFAACMDVLCAKLRRAWRSSAIRHWPSSEECREPHPARSGPALADEYDSLLLIPPQSLPPTMQP